MKKLLTLVLVTITVICTGQNTTKGYSSKGKIGNNNTIWNHKDGDPVGNSKPQKRLKVNYIPTGGHSILVNSLVEDNKIIKNDTTKPLHISGYISAYPIYSGYTGLTTTTPNEYFIVGNGCNKVKVSVTKDLVVTIHVDGFQVTDTIWITKGKQKVGIPAYKFLEYFKDESKYQSFTNPFYSITLTDGQTLEYKTIKEIK